MRMPDLTCSLLEKTFKSLNLGKAFAEKKTIYDWAKIVGEEIAKRTLAKNITDRVLYVTVNNSSWAHHLSMMKREIITKVNRYMGKNIINEIVFRVGSIKPENNREEEEDEEGNDREKKIIAITSKIQLEEKEEEFMDSKVSDCEDEELKKMFRRMLEKNYKLQKAREMVYNSKCRNCGCLCEDNEKYCLSCNLLQKAEAYHSVKRLLFHVPFLSMEICRKETGCTDIDYRRAKNELFEEFIISYKEEEKDIYLDSMIMILYGKELTEPNIKLRASIKRRYVNSFFYKKATTL